MLRTTDDLRIREIKELSTPAEIMREFPRGDAATRTVSEARAALHDILHGAGRPPGRGDRPLLDPRSRAAIEYAERLAAMRERLADRLEIIMRVYFEKPRTTVGWKGLINDPDLDGSFNINEGLRLAREPAVAINELGAAGGLRVPRHDHAAVHRRPGRLGRDRRAHHRKPGASRAGLGPVLPGRLQERHRRQCEHRRRRGPGRLATPPFPGRHQGGPLAIAATAGNEDCHIILRGGNAPNYDAASVDAGLRARSRRRRSPPRLMIDASHGNSSKKPENQPLVVADIAARSRRATAHRRRDGREPSRRAAARTRARQARCLWPEHHRRLHRLGGERRGARTPGGRGGDKARRLLGRVRPQRFAAARGLIGAIALVAPCAKRTKRAEASRSVPKLNAFRFS